MKNSQNIPEEAGNEGNEGWKKGGIPHIGVTGFLSFVPFVIFCSGFFIPRKHSTPNFERKRTAVRPWAFDVEC
jgi:hypothetical protein